METPYQFASRIPLRIKHGYHLARGRRVGPASFSMPSSADNDAALAATAEGSDIGALFASHRGRKALKWVHYFPAYSTQFAPYRKGFPLPDGTTRPLRFLEIGVWKGGSLEIWREYFGPDAVIYGIDIDPECSAFDGECANIRIGSQDDASFLREVVEEMGGIDIVLDDGSHIARHQRAAFDCLFPKVTDTGIYVVEDLHTSYWLRFGGGLRRRGAFVEVIKNVLDDLHHSHHGRARRVLPSGTGVGCVVVYDSIAFFHKQAPTRPTMVSVGGQRLS